MCDGTHFTTPSNFASATPISRQVIAADETFRAHSFELACARNDLDHWLAKARHSSTYGQVERMNRTIKNATAKRDHDNSHAQLRNHLADFVSAYNFARRSKPLCGLALYEAICKTCSVEPSRFSLHPFHQMLEPNSAFVSRTRVANHPEPGIAIRPSTCAF